MKKLKFIVIAILVTIAITGCDPNYGGSTGDTTTNPGTSQSGNVSRTPSLAEIKQVFASTDLTYMTNALKDKVSKLSSITFTDGINYILKIKEIYGGNPVADGQNEYDNVAQVGLLSTYCATSDEIGPILIIKNATVIENGEEKKVNVVLLGGTEIKNGQATGLIEDLYSGMQLTNEYLYDAYYAIYDHLKDDTQTPLVIGGVSLGGMVAQQLAALPALKDYYTIKNVVAIASPILSPDMMDYSKTQVNRMIDTVDLVPQVSVSYNGSYDSAYGSSNKAVVRTSEYKSFIGAHTLGYVDQNIWGDVDVLGNVSGGSKLLFDKANLSWFDAPTLKKAENQ